MSFQLHDAAELALASYSLLGRGNTTDQLGQLANAGFAQTQAIRFAERHQRILAHVDDPTGLSATVFQDGTGRLALAIRGTQLDVNDLRADADIASFGAAY